MADRDEAVGFTLDDARRIDRAVIAVNRALDQAGPGRSPAWTPSIVRAKCTEEIGEGSWDALGSGKAQIFYYDDEGWFEDGEAVDVLNQFGGGPIAVGTPLLLAWISGFWFVDSADC